MVARGQLLASTFNFVIPAQAGIQLRSAWPSRKPDAPKLDSGLRRNDELKSSA